MTIDELNNITKLTNKRKIERALRAAGYFDVTKHKQLRHLSLIELARAEMQDGAEYLTANGKRLFDGQIAPCVNTADGYEFVIVNIYKTPRDPDGEAMQIDILIWAHKKPSLTKKTAPGVGF